MLHLAIRSNNIKIVKVLFISEISDALLETTSVTDIAANLRLDTLKLLSVMNNKGFTPLLSSIDT